MGINKYCKEKLEKLTKKQFKRFMGIDRKVFDKAVKVEEQAYEERHKKGGRKSKFTCFEMIVITLLYLKQYIAMDDIAILFDTVKSIVCDIIHHVIQDLLKDKCFTLFGSKYVQKDCSEDRIIDVTEIRIERPSKRQRAFYSGKKKYHTMKIQIIRGKDTGFIYEIQIGLGAEHDFGLFKRTFKGSPSNVCYEVDLGYLGILKIHSNCLIPNKSSKKHKLTEEEKEFNKLISSERVFIEHTNSWIKRFNILSTRFRNKLTYFAPIAVLLCAFYNCDIA